MLDYQPASLQGMQIQNSQMTNRRLQETRMGVDVYNLKFLSQCHETIGPLGRTMQIGRQGIYLDPKHRAAADAIVRDHGVGPNFDAVGGSEPYAETLYRHLGATDIVACDASPYEGANFIHDLNEPLPAEIPDPFDTVVDGGSLEHIFNVPVALANLMRLTRVGGHILSMTIANNFLGHGFYQFSPDLAFRVFSDENGFEMRNLYLVDLNDNPELVVANDPATSGQRIEIGQTPNRTYLMFVAQKIKDTTPFKRWPQQSDYSIIWESNKP